MTTSSLVLFADRLRQLVDDWAQQLKQMLRSPAARTTPSAPAPDPRPELSINKWSPETKALFAKSLAQILPARRPRDR